MSDPPAHAPQPAPPRDVVDGIGDRAARRPAWKYLLVAAAFVGWMLILGALLLLGR